MTRRSLIGRLALGLAMFRYRPEAIAGTPSAAPPLNSLMVRGLTFTHECQLWKYSGRRVTFLDCRFVGIDVAVEGATYDSCYFRNARVHDFRKLTRSHLVADRPGFFVLATVKDRAAEVSHCVLEGPADSYSPNWVSCEPIFSRLTLPSPFGACVSV